MISFDSFVLDGESPIYQQIIRYLKRGAAAGSIRDGDELPSRRVLSSLLGVNPNTVQKAYRMLEEEGLIASHTGAKSLIVLDEATQQRIRCELIEEQTKNAVRMLRELGVTRSEAAVLLEKYWD